MDKYTDTEKAMILEQIENSGYDEDIQEVFINEMFHPEILEESCAICRTPEEHAKLWESWKKEWGWDGTMSEEYEKDRINE